MYILGMKRRVYLIFILLIIPFLLLAEDYKEKLHKVTKDLKTAKKETKKLKQKEKGILGELSEIDSQILASKKKIKSLRVQERKLKKSIAILKAGGEEINTQLKTQRDFIKNRLFLIYQYKLSDVMPRISYSSGQIDFYIQEVLKRDIQQCNEFKELKASFFTREEKKRAKLSELSEIKKKQEKEKNKILQKRTQKASILKEVRKEKSKKSALISELEKTRSRLEKLIAQLKKYPVLKFKAIIWPVRGKVVGKFGTIVDPELGTKLINNGIDIRANYGTPVIAVSNGEVAYEGTFLGYGEIILLDHRNGFHTLYANLSEILVIKGDKVKKGEVIGKVGTTGSIKEPCLHFELRKEGKAINPLDLLE